jgi:prevent-host-death family protein
MTLKQTATTVGAYDAKTHFSELLEKVEAGEEFTITKHGTPVARLVPVKKNHTRQERQTAIQNIVKLRENQSLGGLKVRDLMREGRR